MSMLDYQVLSKKYIDELSYEVIRAAIEVHKIMGRGLLKTYITSV